MSWTSVLFRPPRRGRAVFVFLCVCEWRGVSSSLNDTLLTLAQNSPSAQSSGEESTQSSKFELPKCRLVVLPPGDLWAKKGEKGEKTKRRKGEKAWRCCLCVPDRCCVRGWPFTESRLLRSGSAFDPTLNPRVESVFFFLTELINANVVVCTRVIVG